jgi:septum formation protein
LFAACVSVSDTILGEPHDKAGGYAFQSIGGKYVKSINGSISAVIGIPIYETKELLTQASE